MKFLEKYKSTPKEIKASFWYIICSILQKGVSIITLPIFTRILTLEQYGQVSVYISWMGLFSIFLSLNLPYGSFQTAMIKFENDRDGYVSSIEGIFILLSTVFLVIYLPTRDLCNSILGLSTPIVLIMVFEILSNSCTQCWMGKQKFEYKYKKVVFLTLFSTFASQILSLVFVICFNDKSTAKIAGNALIVVIIGLIICGFFLLKGKKIFNKKYWGYAFGFNFPLIFYYLSQVVFNQSDKIMIERMCGDAQAGIYSVAYSLGMLLTFVINAITSSYMPWFYNKLKQGKETDDRKVSFILSIIVALLLLVIIAATPEIVYIMSGEKYKEAIAIVPPIAMSVLLLFYADIFDRLFFYFENKLFLTIPTIFAGAINVILNYVYIPKFGFYVAAYTTLISYFLLATIDYFLSLVVAKKRDVNLKMYNIKGMMLVFVLFCGLSALFMLLYNYILIRYVIIVCIISICIIFRKKIISLIKVIKGKGVKDDD